MNQPPPGYDDHSVITRHQLMLLVSKLEEDLSKVKKVAIERLPLDLRTRENHEGTFWHFRHVADTLGADYADVVEKLITIYKQFLIMPSEEKLGQVMKQLSDLKRLIEV